MPRPKGWSTAELARRDDCVAKLKSSGRSASSAYAICTASIQKSRRKKSAK